jgi:hypothetical protein
MLFAELHRSTQAPVGLIMSKLVMIWESLMVSLDECSFHHELFTKNLTSDKVVGSAATTDHETWTPPAGN